MADPSGARVRSLWAMANIVPRLSGIPNSSVYVSEDRNARNETQHGPRVTVESRSDGFDEADVTIGPAPRVVRGAVPARVLEKVVAWLDLNERVLVRLWRAELTQQQALAAIRSVEHTKPITFFHPSLEREKRMILVGEFVSPECSFAQECGLALAVEAGKDEFFLHEVLASVGDQVTRGGTSDVWNASERLAVTKSIILPVRAKDCRPQRTDPPQNA